MNVIAVQRLSWISPINSTGWITLAACCAVTWLALRIFWGKSLTSARLGLWLLRGAAVALALFIALGPTIVDEQAGVESRPTMFYLLDGSQSMQLGGDSTRWRECLDFLEQAHSKAGAEHAHHFKAFRFGHQLRPLTDEAKVSKVSNTAQSLSFDGVDPPDATDSRLADALRQLSPQIDPKNNAGLILFSDGRVRATESVERLAEHFGKSGIPIHVVPVGELQGTGDVAIVSMVVEPRVRKYTENQLTLFIRSFGFTGERSVVKVINRNKTSEGTEEVLAELPITLAAGAQSVSLSFRVEDRPQDLLVVVEPLKGELTARNNQVETRVEIDRTKLRVLYIEGETAVAQSFLSSILNFSGTTNPVQSSRSSNIRDALQADEDIECTVLINRGIGQFTRLAVNDATISASGFPKTRAELFAFDCVVLSNVGPDTLEEEHAQQLALWVEGRGGGLIVTGTQALEAKSWADSPLAPLMPIDVSKLTTAFAQPTPVKVISPNHPIWRLRLEQTLNQQILAQVPPLTLGVSGIKAKPTADVLATVNGGEAWPVLVAHRAGRGRVVVSTADLGGSAMTNLAEHWGPQPERVASKLWRNLVYWATEGSSVGRRRLVANSDKRFYRPGDKLSIDAIAYDESARKSQKYKLWAMFEPMSLEDSSLYSPVLWPENVVRESGEVGPRIAWGEEIPLPMDGANENYLLNLTLSEATGGGDSGLRIEMTAYEGEQSSAADHGTQVDSSSLTIQVLSDPFEQQNPLPNRELLARVSNLSGGRVLEQPADLAKLLQSRKVITGAPRQDITPAWSKWWLWLVLLGLLTSEWIWRRTTGLA